MDNFLKKLKKAEGYVDPSLDPYKQENLIRTGSPSVDWIFGAQWGLPRGTTAILWGEPKSGKSLLCHSMVGSFLSSTPDGIAVRFDTEQRTQFQLTKKQYHAYGIDPERYINFNRNDAEIFDYITDELNAVCDEGANVGLVIIDSLSGIIGRREAKSETITKELMADNAVTVGLGLKRILNVQRRHNFALLLTAQARAEMDPYKIRMGQTLKMAGSYQLKHYAEYFVFVSKNNTKDGKSDELGNSFEDVNKKDLKDKSLTTGHKIRVWMNESSLGGQNRTGEFTFDYNRGIINTHEEIFKLGLRWGVIEKPNNIMYQIGSETFKGKAATVEAIRENENLQKEILTRLQKMDKEAEIGAISSHQASKDFSNLAESDADAEV